MGKVLKTEDFSFSITHLKELGCISGKKANALILEHLCGGTYNNGGLEKYKKYTKKMSELLDKFQVGEGHATKYYYYENDVKWFINTVLSGDEEISVLTLTPAQLKAEGYVSGNAVGQKLWKRVMELKGTNTRNLSEIYEREFKNLRKTVSSKTIGVGKGARRYYLGSEVDLYIENLKI